MGRIDGAALAGAGMADPAPYSPDGQAAAPARTGKLETVELGRGLAALAVVLFHANASARQFGGPDFAWLAFGEHGVDFFFVLSGFIILFAHMRDIGRPGAVRPYLRKRAIRLMPLLWLVVVGYAAMMTANGHAPDMGLLARSLLPWPSLAPAIPRVVWTLRHEILFYAAFMVLLWRPAIGLTLFAAAGLATLGQAIAALSGHGVGGIGAFFLSSYNLQFLMGAGVAFAHHRGRTGQGAAPLLAGLILLAAACLIDARSGLDRAGTGDYVSLVATWWTIALGLVFALLLWGILAIERRVAVPRWGVLLGGASYAIYLTHTPANSILQRLAVHLPAPVLAAGGGHLLLIAGGVGAGLLLHLHVERRILDLLRSRWIGPPAIRGGGADGAGPA